MAEPGKAEPKPPKQINTTQAKILMKAGVAQPGRASVKTRARSLTALHNFLLTQQFMEFYGIMVGDETLYHKHNCKYFFTISEGYKDYAQHIAGLVYLLIGRYPRIKYRSKAFQNRV